MNSVEALDFAIHILRNRQRRLSAPAYNPTAEAIETLAALRQFIADNAAPPTRAEEQHAQQTFFNAYVRNAE